VITRATLPLIPAPERVWQIQLFYPDLATMLGDARLLAGDERFDAVQGAVLFSPSGPLTFRLDAAKHVTASEPDGGALLTGLSDDPARRAPTTMTYRDYLHRLAAFETALRSAGLWSRPHPWLATFLGDSAVHDLASGVLAALDPAALGQFGQVALSPIRRAAVTSPLLRLPAEDVCHAFNLIRVPGSAGPAAESLVADNRAVYEQVRAAGGTLYPVSALPMAPGDWRRHFGPAYDHLAQARRTFDPLGVLAPGYELFAA
jgi:FAD/FMN-containing dehydrogenase